MKKIIIVIFVLCFVSANAQKFQTSIFVSPNYSFCISQTEKFYDYNKLNYGVNLGFKESFIKNNIAIELSIIPTIEQYNFITDYEIGSIVMFTQIYYIHRIRTLNLNNNLSAKLNFKKNNYLKVGTGVNVFLYSKYKYSLYRESLNPDEDLKKVTEIFNKEIKLKTDNSIPLYLIFSFGRNFYISKRKMYAEISYSRNLFSSYYIYDAKKYKFKNNSISLTLGYKF